MPQTAAMLGDPVAIREYSALEDGNESDPELTKGTKAL
jgi:hypothetical protein